MFKNIKDVNSTNTSDNQLIKLVSRLAEADRETATSSIPYHTMTGAL